MKCMYVEKLIKISESVLNMMLPDNNEINSSGEEMIQNAEKSLFDLAERGHFNQSFMKFEKALSKQ